MRKCLIFCHGWGGTLKFWNMLKEFFANDQNVVTFFLDLGYFGTAVEFIPIELLSNQELEFIGIGHSLGLIKLLALKIKFKALIGLQSFINFLGNDPKLNKIRRKELNLLIKNFSFDPENTLKGFYQFVGINSMVNNQQWKIDRDKLLEDLKSLSLKWDLKYEIPVLIIGANNDPIVPPELIFDNFVDYPSVRINILPKGEHGLGYKNPEVIYQIIMKFLHAIN